jgi:carboxymethylenebutenolidase
MPHSTITLDTADGRCPVHVYHPDGDGPWPAAIVYMDGIGMRPAVMEIAQRLALEGGCFVMLPDLFYRIGFTGDDGKRMFASPDGIATWKETILPAASSENVMRDTEALLAHLDTHAMVRRDGGIGVTGYCMGGRLALHAAGHFGDRIAAAASYHGGGLATDAPDSPHRLADRMRARIYVAGAIEDRGFDDAQKARLEQALTDAGVEHLIETYNARHGWVPADTAAHDPVEAEHHWRTLLALFRYTLGGERTSHA